MKKLLLLIVISGFVGSGAGLVQVGVEAGKADVANVISNASTNSAQIVFDEGGKNDGGRKNMTITLFRNVVDNAGKWKAPSLNAVVPDGVWNQSNLAGRTSGHATEIVTPWSAGMILQNAAIGFTSTSAPGTVQYGPAPFPVLSDFGNGSGERIVFRPQRGEVK